MCLDQEAFSLFLSLLDADALRPHLSGLLVGDAQTLWVWVSDIARWCIDGKDVINATR